MRRSAPTLPIFLFALAGCSPEPPPPDRLTLTQTIFSDLPGWTRDRHADAVPALTKSCAVLHKLSPVAPIGHGPARRLVRDWLAPCEALASIVADDHTAARAYFERWFVPYRAANNDEPNGLFTGYFEPELRGSRTRRGRYTVPLYIRPPELVTVDLGKFRESLRGERLAGRVVAGRMEPFSTRAQIDAGALSGRDLELVWVDNPVDAFFLHIQGSGRVVLDDGALLRVGYAATNGHEYKSIGRVLADQGEILLEKMSMQVIRAWLSANPGKARTLMDRNASFVFFRELKGTAPNGAQGVQLTAGRSLAVDHRFVPLGVPVWLDTTDPLAPRRKLRRLFVTQDTGGAIRGPVRGDVFWGHGPAAAQRAGKMKQRGEYFLLLPRPVTSAKTGQRQ